MQAFIQHTGLVAAAGSRERGHRPDDSQAIPEALTREGFGKFFFTTGAICPAKSRIRNLC